MSANFFLKSLALKKQLFLCCRLGFTVREEDILTPALAMAALIRQHHLRPHLLVHPDVMEDLGVQGDQGDQEDPNCVVVGDAGQGFNFDSLNRCSGLCSAGKWWWCGAPC